MPVVTQCVYCGGETKRTSSFCRLCGSGILEDRGPSAKLIFLEGESPREYLISQQERFLGRDASSDIVLDDDQVSGRHIRIGYEGGEFRVRDLGSTNGTFVNGERIGGSVILKNEDLVKIGGTIIKLMV